MRVLIACEFSATVRDAFRAAGHDAWSCDLEPTEGDPEFHIQADAKRVLTPQMWDLIIAFPPCTDLAASGARWWPSKRADGRQQAAVEFVLALWDAPVERMAVENPVGWLSTAWRKPDQIIHPWQYGHGETKTTCLWTRGLPPLVPTDVVAGREPRIHRMPGGRSQARNRSRTYAGIAAAMAAQWGAMAEVTR